MTHDEWIDAVAKIVEKYSNKSKRYKEKIVRDLNGDLGRLNAQRDKEKSKE